MTMRAMVLRGFGSPLCLEAIEKPRPGPGEVLVRVKACGVCRTDLKIAAGKLPIRPHLPHVMGHEAAGEIGELGEGVSGLSVGDRVAVYFYRPCRSCLFCLSGLETSCENQQGQIGFTANGGYAEYLVAPAINVARLAPHVSFAEGAIVADAIATTLQGLKNRVGLRAGETVLVVGCGGLGLHAVQVARLFGAQVIAVDRDPGKLEHATGLGADVTLDAAAGDLVASIRAAANGLGAEVTVDLVGNAGTVALCTAAARSGGRLLLLGYDSAATVAVASADIVIRQLSLVGSRAATLQSFREAVDLVNRGLIKPVVTDHFRLEEANDVLERLDRGAFVGRAVMHVE